MEMVRDLEKVSADIQEQKERIESVDYKMITFSLAGKDYGVDIMNVKEIAKADKFTYVPNAASYVRGVYNLRGDIIPIIDMRNFFHLPIEKKEGMENMLILTIEDRVYGTIVDKIDKVIGINKEQIQPPHPIFGDINIKFISGVVEKEGALYIILDVVRIFSISAKEEETKPRVPDTDVFYRPPPSSQEAVVPAALPVESSLDFIRQSLPVIKHFYPSAINEVWLRERYADWSIGRKEPDLQLRDIKDAEDFLSQFYSPSSGGIWHDEYATLVKEVLPNINSAVINVWNIGCGKGYETYSFACILKSRYPGSRFKIWANDSDIMAISQAPSLFFEMEEVPEYCRDEMVRGSSGYTFNQEIKDSILFEYHDISNDNALPDLDIIVARDILSYITVQQQATLVNDFFEKIKSHGIVIIGANEVLLSSEWRAVAKPPVSAFVKK